MTQGDPDGVGPELILALAADGTLGRADRVVADPAVLDRTASRLGTEWAARGRAALAGRVLEVEPHRDAGRSQVAALRLAVDRVLQHPGTALVTAPIDKRVCVRAGFEHPGHTEYLAARAGTEDFAMFMVGPVLRVALATIHVPLCEVPARLSAVAIARVVALVVVALRRDFELARPRIAVLGLNPHAGEGGVLGSQEQAFIAPTVRKLAAQHAEAAQIVGPLPADTAFAAHARGDFDAVVAMFHDQGLPAFKVMHFADGINVTLGLPFVRTSPDHGTAKDIAGRGVADASSMRAAVLGARTLAAARIRGDGG